MKRLYLYIILAAALAACTSDSPEGPAPSGDDYGMHFRAVTCGMSRANPTGLTQTGIYDKTTYPVTNLYLTAYLVEETKDTQYYLRDELLDYADERWSAAGWYWPLQGKMWFLSYWSPGLSGAPTFDEIVDADGNKMARMEVDATNLDGKTDFLYLASKKGVDCPQIGTNTLQYTHGLTWITLTMKAEVLKADGVTPDDDKTDDLIAHLDINKVVIEKCARKGFATVIPGKGISWKTTDTYIRDQVYCKNDDPNNFSRNTWNAYKNGEGVDVRSPLPKLTNQAQTLGVYTPDGVTGDTYIYEGLLIIPQNKTAITIDYTVTDISNRKTQKVERYELRDNDIAWLPGYHYNYDIIFRNYDDYADNFEVVPSWSGIYLDEDNYCFDNVFGTVSATGTPAVDCGFVLEPMHDGGSATGDDMDYPEGPRLF